jgi:arylsulfate sulfotransferase
MQIRRTSFYLCDMKQWLLIICIISVFGCKKNGGEVAVSNLIVLNDTSSALTARVKFSLNRLADASITVTDQATGESKSTALSKEKIHHNITVTNLEENTTYKFRIHVTVGSGDNEWNSTEQTFTTAKIPSFVKSFYDPAVNTLNETEGSHFLFNSRGTPKGCIFMIDHKGRLVWYRISKNPLKVVRLTKKKTLLCLEDENNTPYGDGNLIMELSLGGDTLFFARQNTGGFDKSAHHDLCLNHRGNIVAVTNVFKSNGTMPGDGLLELDRNGKKVWEWTTFDSPDAAETGINNQPWINSLVQDTDNNYIISLRSFSQVWKINSVTGAVMWKLGKGGNIQMDAADEFLFQHYAHRNPAGDLMLFDNGSAARPVSRLMSFSIDEQQKKATTRLRTELPASLYSNIMGSSMMLPDQHLLTASSTNSQFVKTNAAGNVLWSIKVAEPFYRAEFVGNPFANQ